jgi:RNA polymerase sigma-70 factor (sigma-E family)
VADTEAEFTAFVAARSGALMRTAHLLAGDRQHGEDLLQQTLTKVYLSWRKIRDPQAAEAYARRTLATTAVSWRRRRWHGEHASEVLPERLGDADETAGVDERLRVWKAIAALPAKQRAVVVLRYYEDLSESEIAALLGVSAGTVKSQASRALASLRGRLGEVVPHPIEDAS